MWRKHVDKKSNQYQKKINKAFWKSEYIWKASGK